MNNDEIKNAVFGLTPLTVKFKRELVDALNSIYPGYSTKEAACLFYSGMVESPKCRVCGSRTPFYPLARAVIKSNIGGWNDVCSHACSFIKNKETCLDRYGATHHLKKESSSDSMKKQGDTNERLYGKRHVLQVADINENMQSGILNRNNGFHYMNEKSESGIPEKIRKTTKIDYGTDYYFQTDICKEKIKSTYIEKYGTENHTSIPAIREKIKESCLKRFGVDNPWKNPEIIEKIQADRYKKLAEVHPNVLARRFYSNLLDHDDSIALQFEMEDLLSIGVENSLIGISKHIGIPLSHINSILANNPSLKRYINYDTRMSSYVERDLISHFENLGHEVLRNDRKIVYPKELDCVFPNKKLAIEINGVYYHSEIRGGKGALYHLDKTEKCNSKGYKLFHFTDVQIDKKRSIVFSMIKNSLGETNDRIFARKTKIKMVAKDDSKKFFESNHIDGNARSDFTIGLVYGEELVMCISFGKPRNGHDKGYDYEIIRMATKLDTQVIGGFQKIWTYFLNSYSPESVMSYQDRSYGGTPSTAYSSVMRLERVTSPSWQVVNIKTGELFHRLWFSKNRMRKQFGDTFEENKSTKDNLVKHGFDCLWNCGNYVWTYKKPR